jgi:hypothetical protein
LDFQFSISEPAGAGTPNPAVESEFEEEEEHEESPKSQVGAPLVRTAFFDGSGNPLMLILKASFVWLQQVIDLGGQDLQVLISLRVMR